MGVQKCCGQQSCTENDLPPKNDRRCQLINEIKELIGNIEHEDKAKPRQSRRPDRGVPGMRDLEDECRQWRKRRECTPPLITTIALHETRPTSDYTNMRHENSSQLTYVDATQEGQEWRKVPPAPWDLPRTPSQELRAGNLYVDCQCLKRNGLQHDCPRWECGGRPECVAVNPGPCCIPSQWPKPIRGDRRYGNKPQPLHASVAGKQDYGQKQLKTGPINPEICIPMEASSQPQRTPEVAGQPVGFIGSGNVPRQGVIGIVAVGPMQHGAPQAPFQNIQGMVPSNQSHQMTQTPQPTHGRVPHDGMVLVLNQVQPGIQSRQPPLGQGAAQNITLSAPGITCCCRPIQSAPAAGSPGRLGVMGIPMAVVSSPMP